MTRTLSGSRPAISVALILGGLLACPTAPAADHADPIDPLRLSDDDDRGLTGLFVFPVNAKGNRVVNPNDGDSLILILCANRLLAKPPPYRGLESFEFFIRVDTARKVNVHYPKELARPANAAERNTARYGGVVENPDAINPTFEIRMRLRNDFQSEFNEHNVLDWSLSVDRGDGLKPVDQEERKRLVPRVGAGVRDDPFIFPMFFGTNVIAMAARVPYDTFKVPHGSFRESESLLLWGTSERNRAQTDHVGRAQRTQLPRFDLLNTIPPGQHVRAIREARENPDVRTDVLRFLFPAEFNFRPFDDHPDVTVFTKRHPSGFPNGRRLEDDVAKLTCDQGDCQLYELSFVGPRTPEAERYGKYDAGRPTANDRPFLDEWPYLAEAQTEPSPPPPTGLRTRTLLILGGVATALFAFGFALPWFLYFRSGRQLRRLHQTLAQYTASIPPAPPLPTPDPPPGTGGPQP